MRILLILIFLGFSSVGLSAGGAPCGHYLSENGTSEGQCDDANVDPTDLSSLQRGAQTYVNYCLGCHSLKYARYKRVSEDLGIPLEIFKDNLIFGDQKLGDLIEIGMDPVEAKKWFGNAPPDLTLEAGLRGPDWIYTYLKSFYIDESRPLGVNNKVYENVGMPHVLFNVQGEQRSVCRQVSIIAKNGGLKQDPLSGKALTQEQCGFLEVTKGTGEVSPEEFDLQMRDLTNFLAYMTDPGKTERESIGFYVLFYLLIFTILSYLLYREFKKDLY
jgi:cytochrome c1|tara:strand:+ start:84 stop:902 length:819 start_codon:yes stop_codon:yes gene_type:complete